MVTEERSFPLNGSPKSHNDYRGNEFSSEWVINVPTWLPKKGVSPQKGSPTAHNSYRGKEFSRKRVTKGLQWLPKKGVFRPKGHQSASMVTEERSFPKNGSSMVLNGYREHEFPRKRVTKSRQWLPKTGVFRPKGHQSPSIVTEERSFPPKGLPKALNGYRRKEFPRKRVTNRSQW